MKRFLQIKQLLLICLFILSSTGKAQLVTEKSFRMTAAKTGVLRGERQFNEKRTVSPVALNQSVCGLSISGTIIFSSEKAFVRVVLLDTSGNEHLIFESCAALESQWAFSFNEICEETALLNDIVPESFVVECEDAEVTIHEVQYSAGKKIYLESEYGTLRKVQEREKIDRINSALSEKRALWWAGETGVSALSYSEKKAMFGGKLPNLAGFEYYKGGIFIMPGYESTPVSLKQSGSGNTSSNASPFVDSFDWRNRHGINWMTPTKSRGSVACGACWAFGAIGTIEPYTKLYFNDYNKQLFDDYLDLSEYQLIACLKSGICYGSGGSTLDNEGFNYAKNTGVVNSSCYNPTWIYNTDTLHCNDVCSNPNERIKIEGYGKINLANVDTLKSRLIRAPMTLTLFGAWYHAVVLAGYKALRANDLIFVKRKKSDGGDYWEVVPDSLIGANAWLVQNNWGNNWGDNGFAYIVENWSANSGFVNYLLGKITSLNYTDDDIRCEDRDDDGYYFWGIGSKPSTCPSCAPDEPDGDDSDYSVGPMNQYGHCQINTPLVSSPTIIEMSQIWSGTRTVNSDIVIKPGISLTLTGKLNMPAGKHIVVHGCDGELTINGGTLNNANITVKPGGQLKLLNNAKINLNGAELNVEGGGILDDTYGEINCN